MYVNTQLRKLGAKTMCDDPEGPFRTTACRKLGMLYDSIRMFI